jgi:hypothetical protein
LKISLEKVWRQRHEPHAKGLLRPVVKYGFSLTGPFALNNYTIWAQIKRTASAGYEVTVRAIPLTSDVMLQHGEVLRDHCQQYLQATTSRDELVQRLIALLEKRGDKILEIDSAPEPGTEEGH